VNEDISRLLADNARERKALLTQARAALSQLIVASSFASEKPLANLDAERIGALARKLGEAAETMTRLLKTRAELAADA